MTDEQFKMMMDAINEVKAALKRLEKPYLETERMRLLEKKRADHYRRKLERRAYEDRIQIARARAERVRMVQR